MPSPFSLLGPRPAGDPLGMTLYAFSLEAAADDAAAAGAKAGSALDGATFVGPAGDHARVQAGDLRARSRDCAHELRALAQDVRRRAATIRDAQQAWDRDKRLEDARRARDPFPAPDLFGAGAR